MVGLDNFGKYVICPILLRHLAKTTLQESRGICSVTIMTHNFSSLSERKRKMPKVSLFTDVL